MKRCRVRTRQAMTGLEGAEAGALAWLRDLVGNAPSDRLAALEGLSDLGDLVPRGERARGRSPSVDEIPLWA